MEDSTLSRTSDSTANRPGTVRGRFDWSETEPTVAVVETVAVAADRPPLDVYQLHDVIDTDALNALIHHGGNVDSPLQVTVSVAGCEVTVDSDGLVRADVVEEV